MKKFVRISSELNIDVTCGLQAIDATNFDSPNADRLNVKSGWQQFTVPIKQGVGYYPSEIKNWATVQALQKAGKLTIGEECDECENQEEVMELKNKLTFAAQRYDQIKEQAVEAEKRRVATVKSRVIASDNPIDEK